jgi:hypothetical protein
MHRHSLDPHVAAGAMDAQRDLAAIGDEDFLEHSLGKALDALFD